MSALFNQNRATNKKPIGDLTSAELISAAERLSGGSGEIGGGPFGIGALSSPGTLARQLNEILTENLKKKLGGGGGCGGRRPRPRAGIGNIFDKKRNLGGT